MAYNYEEQKSYIFTQKGTQDLLKMKTHCRNLLINSGAFTMEKAFTCAGVTADSWERMSLVDFLCEAGEFKEISENGCAGQYRVFVNYKI